jgi:hypothetical protein
MRRSLAYAVGGAAILLVAACFARVAAASELWMFCVASALGGDDVWITDVFAATRSRERLESEVKVYLARQGAARVDIQCPAPAADKTAAVNARFAAAEFNRKLGHTLHEALARDLVRKR